MKLSLELPFPPSTNTYWRHVVVNRKPRTLISASGRKFRTDVIWLCRSQKACKQLSQPLAVNIQLYPPDRKRRDLDNYNKALLDALTHAGVYLDDSQINRLSIARGPVLKGGKVTVEIETIEEHEHEFTDH